MIEYKYMYRYSSNYILLFLVCILSFSLSSCREEINNTLSLEENGEYNILEIPFTVLNRGTSVSNPTTLAVRSGVSTEVGDFDQSSYGIDPLNENKIEKLDLFIISSTTEKVEGYYSMASKSLIHEEGSLLVKAKVPKTTADALEGKAVQIYLIANAKQADFSGVTTYDQLKALVQDDKNVLSPDPVASSGGTEEVQPQEKFLMDGSLDCTLSWGTATSHKVTKTVPLRRAASKIRVRIDDINVTDHQNGIETKYAIVEVPCVKLVHYTEKGTLIQSDAPYPIQPADWKTSSAYRKMEKRTFSGKNITEYPKYNGDFYAAMPFYAYENDWSTKEKQANETYVLIKVKMRPVDEQGNPYKLDEQGNVVTNGSGTVDPGRDYFYRLPINYRMEMDEVPTDRLNKLERNYLYDIHTAIEVLGSIDEGIPVDVESNLAVVEWNKPDAIDGSIAEAHFLVVKELTPLMPNINTREVRYISSTPVDITIKRAYYQYYDVRGDYYRVEYDAYGHWKRFDKTNTPVEYSTDLNNVEPWDSTAVIPSSEHLENGILTIKHKVPVNYVPFYIEFEVKQQLPGTLSETVVVTQYPPRFVTGHESTGLWNGSEKLNGSPVYADFRHQTPLGNLAPYKAIGSNVLEPQGNEIFSRVTTVVPKPGEIIGIAVDEAGRTKSDEISNKMISPEFIISTQYGMTQGTFQREDQSEMPPEGFYTYQFFGADYGPNSGRAKFKRDPEYLNNEIHNDPYYGQTAYTYTIRGVDDYGYPAQETNYVRIQNDPYEGNENKQYLWRTYTTAEDRCYNYFEDNYGTDGYYVENYLGADGYWKRREIYKTFKYKGRWRIPTKAEITMINKLQIDPRSTVKGLMFGSYYWSAEDGIAFDFANGTPIAHGSINPYYGQWGGYYFPNIFVRCVFDTFGMDDKGEAEIRK